MLMISGGSRPGIQGDVLEVQSTANEATDFHYQLAAHRHSH